MARLSDIYGSETFRRLNPDLFPLARLPGAEPKPTALTGGERKDTIKKGRKTGPVFRVTIVSFRRRILDEDNLAGGFKALRDAIAGRLGMDDADGCINWEYGQVKTAGQQGTVVKIEKLDEH